MLLLPHRDLVFRGISVLGIRHRCYGHSGQEFGWYVHDGQLIVSKLLLSLTPAFCHSKGPIKILFPRSLTPDEETGKINLALLGLGDIVIPGFFLSLLLRFDAHLAKVPTSYTDVHYSFPKPYFHSALIFYILGMCTTMGVMIFFEAAQPALLYLVPACLISSLGCAFFRGELKELFEYSEEAEEEEEKETEKKSEEAKKDK